MYRLVQGEQDHIHPCALAQVPPRVQRDDHFRCLQRHRGLEEWKYYEGHSVRSEHQARFRPDPETIPCLVGGKRAHLAARKEGDEDQGPAGQPDDQDRFPDDNS